MHRLKTSQFGGMALALAAGILLAGVGVAHASKCDGDWSDAPAEEYCPNAVVSDIVGTSLQAQTPVQCAIGANCSVTFSYGPEGATVSTTLNPFVQMTVDRADVDDIVICILEERSATTASSVIAGVRFTATARTSCDASEYTAQQAVDGQFVTPTPGN